MTMGTGDCRTMAVAVFRQGGQVSIGPSGVEDQSKSRIRRVVSPSPLRKLAADADEA
jgi:hypothetical protein